jgi:tetratricopeptide (TPR) repeat protein
VVALVITFPAPCSCGETNLERLEEGIYLEETAADLEGAAKVYREILEDAKGLRATLAEAQYRLADCLAKQGENEEAVKLLDELIVQYPEQRGFVAAARSRLRSLPRKEPGPEVKARVDELQARGWELWRQQKYGEAEVVFREGVEVDPVNSNLWNGLGWSLFHQGKREEAKEAFLECLKHEPIQPGAHNGLGWIFYAEKEYDNARDAWEEALRVSPYATASLSGLTDLYMEQEEYEKAAEYYRKWLEVEPDSARAKTGLKRAEAGLESGRQGVDAEGLQELPRLLEELDNPPPGAPRFEALNMIVKIGSPAVPVLIERMKISGNWQVPKALGAIGDEAAVEPLVEKLQKSDFSPMREVIVEALERITGEKAGETPRLWRDWWEEERDMDEPYWGRIADRAIEEGDLIGVCDAELQRAYIRGETGHAYIDKITLPSKYEKLVEKTNPSPERKQKYYEDALAVLKEHPKPLYKWRVLHLRSAIAADLGKDDLAMRDLEEALDAYPEKDYGDPSKQSFYHHMVNQAAALIWDASGVEAAEDYFLDRLANDAKCEYFFHFWWEKKYQEEGMEDRFPSFTAKVVEAYEQRAENFPAKRERIEEYVARLQGN